MQNNSTSCRSRAFSNYELDNDTLEDESLPDTLVDNVLTAINIDHDNNNDCVIGTTNASPSSLGNSVAANDLCEDFISQHQEGSNDSTMNECDVPSHFGNASDVVTMDFDTPRGLLKNHVRRVYRGEKVMFFCNYCVSKWKYKRSDFSRYNGSTSNILKHVRAVHPSVFCADRSALSPTGCAYVSEVELLQLQCKPDAERLIRTALSHFVVENTEPFSVVDSDAFLKLLYLCLYCRADNITIPRSTALRYGIFQQMENMKATMKSKFALVNSCFNLCLDMWTSSNSYSFIAITAHYVSNDWQLQEHLIAFDKTTDHTGLGMSEIVFETIEEFGLTNKLGSITMDNASNNNTLMSSLATTLLKNVPTIQWDAKENRVRCVAHVINLAVKAFLKAIGSDETALQSNGSDQQCGLLIKKIRKIVKKLRGSPQQRKAYLAQLALAHNELLMLALDVPTRWNSTFTMIKRVLKVRQGLNVWLMSNPIIGTTNMASLKITDNEFKTLENVSNMLSPFEGATKMMSGEKYTTLSLVLPSFYELFNFVECSLEDKETATELLNALKAAKKALIKYYDYLKESSLYVQAVLLDPRFKKTFFATVDYNERHPGAVDDAIAKIKIAVGHRSLRNNVIHDTPNTSNLSGPPQTTFFSSLFKKITTNNIPADEVDKYLALVCANETVDPIRYWKSHAQEFPNLCQVAIDILSIPGSATSVERIFNIGKDMIALRRYSLKPETLKALMFCKAALRK